MLDFDAEPPVGRGTKCSVGEVLALLDPESAAAFLAKLDDESYDSERICRVLKKAGIVTDRGVAVGANAVRRHRRGVCACDP